MRTYCAILAVLLITLPGADADQRKRGRADRAKSSSKAPPPVGYDPAAINQPEQPAISPKDRGNAVLRAQILLDRAHFSVGEIDGYFGTNMQKALAAYLAERKIDSAGMWAALNADTAPALVPYTITAADVAGPFTPIPKDMQEQASLPRLGYTSALEGIAERVHASPALLKALNPGARFTEAGESILAPNVLTGTPGQAANIVVSKSESSVRAYGADGKLLAFYPATAGSTYDPLPIGKWKINGVSRNPKFHYNPKFFWDAKETDSKAVIPPGPNNPVGVVWIDLSVEHNGIHGTPEPSRIGHTFSHGCIRLTNWDAAELADMVKPGTPAVLTE
jgi:lipoprotein-anchoring transpeptidase ErfK/SrfK